MPDVPLGDQTVIVNCCSPLPGTTPPATAPYVIMVNGLQGFVNLIGTGAFTITSVGNDIIFSVSAAAGLGSVTSVGLSSNSAALVVGGSPITTSGTFTLTLDAALTNLAGLTWIADRMAYSTGVDTFALTTLTSFARSILDDANAAASRSTLGGTTVGQNIFTQANPGGVRFNRINADDSVSALTAVQTITALNLTIGTNTQAQNANLQVISDNSGTVSTNAVAYSVGSITATGDITASGRIISAGAATSGATLLQLLQDGNDVLTVLDTGATTLTAISGFSGNVLHITSVDLANLLTLDQSGQMTVLSTVFALGFEGSGNGLTNLSADAITSGTLPSARLVGAYTGITQVGALSAGSLASGFTVVTGALGGTGVANTGKTITIGGNLTTSGAFATTFTVTAATAVVLPTSGTLYGTQSGSITSAQLAASLSDETGSGLAVFNISAALISPALTSPSFDKTITAAGTTGAQTINHIAGSVNFAAAATTLVVTNSLVSSTSRVFCFINTDDSTAVLKNVVCTSGSFTIKMATAPTAETAVAFFVLN